MKAFYIFLITSLFTFNLSAQEKLQWKGVDENKFFYQFLNFKSDEQNKTRVDVFVQIPYTEIQFVKSNEYFVADYTVTVSVFDMDKENLVTEKMWNEKVETKSFNETTSKHNYNLSLRSFNISPGEYLFRTSYEDKDSRKTFFKEDEVKVRDLSSDIAISDIMLISQKTSEKGNSRIVPNIPRSITSQKDGIVVFYELYSDKDTTVTVEYNIKDKENIVYSDEKSQQLIKGRNQIFYTYTDSTMSLGDYHLNAVVKNNDDEEITSNGLHFVSRWIGFPSIVRDLDEAIEQLVYIASNEEMDYISEGENKKEKKDRYLKFWKKKDPVPSTEENRVFDEYYSRVAYANANFSHYRPGWKTDRGMVLILLGSPNNVERHPFDFDSKPYEVWEYYQLNRRFVFVDETGFGDYRLVTPLYGDLYRYRY